MTVSSFLYSFNLASLVFSVVLSIDILLPSEKFEGYIQEYHSPLSHNKRLQFKSTSKLMELIIATSEGKIRCSSKGLPSFNTNENIQLLKTPILSIPTSIYFIRQDEQSRSSNILFGPFIFLPFLTAIFSVLTLRATKIKALHNIGSGAVVLVPLIIYLVVKDYLT